MNWDAIAGKGVRFIFKRYPLPTVVFAINKPDTVSRTFYAAAKQPARTHRQAQLQTLTYGGVR